MSTLSPHEALIALNLVPGVGTILIQRLLESFGSAELVLHAPRKLLEQVRGMGRETAAAVADWRNCTNASAEIAAAEALGARLVVLTDEDYPTALRSMADPPIVLTVRGEVLPQDSEHPVALVGTRHATPNGLMLAREYGRELADAGCTIVSGLANGVDYAAHCGALDAGGRTIAVLGFGMGELHRSANAELAESIIAGHGAVVSEFPLYRRADKTTFPQRNRIVAGWAAATAVIEAPNRSGALLTARLAAEQYGRRVFAVPGRPRELASAGCNELIRDGATLTTSPQEFLADMEWDGQPHQMDLFAEEGVPTTARAQAPASLPRPAPGSQAAELLAAVQAGHDTLDALCAALGLGASAVAPLLLQLQISGHLRPLEGARFTLRA